MKAYEYVVEFTDKASSNAQRVAKEMGMLDSQAEKVDTTMGEAGMATKKYSKELEDMKRPLSNTTSLMGGLRQAAGALGLTLALSGIMSLGSSMSAAGANIESARISFQTMMGDVEKGNKTLAMLNDFSNVTPFTNDVVIESGRNLIAFGIENDKLKGTLQAVGDVAAGLKIPFNELSEIYGKIKVQQTVYSEDLNQLAGRGIPIFTELAKVMGVQSTEIKKLASEGKIGFDQIEKAFVNMTSKGGMFFGMMEKQSETFSGKASTLEGKVQLVAAGMGEGLNKFFMPAMDSAIGMVDLLADSMKPLSQQYEEQEMKVRRLTEETEPMINRYKELTAKAHLNKEEHIELKSITEQLAGAIPSAVTEWNKYGEAIGLNTTKLEEFVRLNKDAKKELNAQAIAEQERIIFNLEREAGTITGKLNEQAKQGFIYDTRGGSGLMSKRVIGDDELTKMSQKVNAIRGEGGLIEMARREIARLSGEDLDVGDGGKLGGNINVDGDGDDTLDGLESITAGGNKSITINMPGLKFAETIEINPQTLQEGLADIEPQMRDFFTRLLNSGLQTATQY